jgi:uncharacterized protein with FMN-binding domain
LERDGGFSNRSSDPNKELAMTTGRISMLGPRLIRLALILALFVLIIASESFVAQIGLSQEKHAEDVIELTSGAKVPGKIISSDGDEIVIETMRNGRTFTRKYPKSKVAAFVEKGARKVLNDVPTDKQAETKSPSVTDRSEREVLDVIAKIGKTPPDWFDQTRLNYPDTLDLKWPEPAPTKDWDNQRNMGQFIWDRVNPNPDRWREGIRLMHHLLKVNEDDPETVQRVMRELGSMYFRLFQDYSRAAFWFQQSGSLKDPNANTFQTVQLAECYLRLGSKEMAMNLLNKLKRRPIAVIKLLGELGETDTALNLAEKFSKSSSPDGATLSFLYAGDICRKNGDLDQAEAYYQKALSSAQKDQRNNQKSDRNLKRAESNIAAIKFLRLDPTKVKDGTYEASALGYEDQVHVKVVVRKGKIESVEVTQHVEKQFYSSITDTTKNIVDRQTILIDATSGATITSEAIINATAKALFDGLK